MSATPRSLGCCRTETVVPTDRYIIITVLWCLSSVSSLAVACDCGILPEEYLYCNSHLVVLAKIRNIWPIPEKDLQTEINALSLTTDPKSFGFVGAHYEVIEAYKGNPTTHGFVYTTNSGASCGVRLQQDALALLKINKDGFISLCGFNEPNLDETGRVSMEKKYRSFKKMWVKNPRAYCDAARKRAK